MLLGYIIRSWGWCTDMHKYQKKLLVHVSTISFRLEDTCTRILITMHLRVLLTHKIVSSLLFSCHIISACNLVVLSYIAKPCTLRFITLPPPPHTSVKRNDNLILTLFKSVKTTLCGYSRSETRTPPRESDLTNTWHTYSAI